MSQSHTSQHLLYGSHQSLCALLLLWLDRLGRHSEDCVNIFAGKCRAIDVGAGSRSREESGQLFLAEIAARPFLQTQPSGPSHISSLLHPAMIKGTVGQFVFSSGSHLLSMFSNVSLRVRSKHSTTTLEQEYERGRNVSLVDEVSRTVSLQPPFQVST